jgi:hypothetical protein
VEKQKYIEAGEKLRLFTYEETRNQMNAYAVGVIEDRPPKGTVIIHKVGEAVGCQKQD